MRKNNRISKEEKEFLEQYDVTKFERPSVTADIVIFTLDGAEGSLTRTTGQSRAASLMQAKNLSMRLQRGNLRLRRTLIMFISSSSILSEIWEEIPEPLYCLLPTLHLFRSTS